MPDFFTRQHHYLLNDKYPVPVSMEEWVRNAKFGEPEWTVAKTKFFDAEVSTVFLGLDHGFGSELPMLFETMIFGGKHDQWQNRCATWVEAEMMHQDAVEMIRRSAIAS